MRLQPFLQFIRQHAMNMVLGAVVVVAIVFIVRSMWSGSERATLVQTVIPSPCACDGPNQVKAGLGADGKCGSLDTCCSCIDSTTNQLLCWVNEGGACTTSWGVPGTCEAEHCAPVSYCCNGANPSVCEKTTAYVDRCPDGSPPAASENGCQNCQAPPAPGCWGACDWPPCDPSGTGAHRCPDTPVCTPGATEACTGGGLRTCNPSGFDWGPCTGSCDLTTHLGLCNGSGMQDCGICSSSSSSSASCGNGRVDPGEECDAGAQNNCDEIGVCSCLTTCKLPCCWTGVDDLVSAGSSSSAAPIAAARKNQRVAVKQTGSSSSRTTTISLRKQTARLVAAAGVGETCGRTQGGGGTPGQYGCDPGFICDGPVKNGEYTCRPITALSDTNHSCYYATDCKVNWNCDAAGNCSWNSAIESCCYKPLQLGHGVCTSDCGGDGNAPMCGGGGPPNPVVPPGCFPAPVCGIGFFDYCPNGWPSALHTWSINPVTCQCVPLTIPYLPCSGGGGGGGSSSNHSSASSTSSVVSSAHSSSLASSVSVSSHSSEASSVSSHSSVPVSSASSSQSSISVSSSLQSDSSSSISVSSSSSSLSVVSSSISTSVSSSITVSSSSSQSSVNACPATCPRVESPAACGVPSSESASSSQHSIRSSTYQCTRCKFGDCAPGTVCAEAVDGSNMRCVSCSDTADSLTGQDPGGTQWRLCIDKCVDDPVDPYVCRKESPTSSGFTCDDTTCPSGYQCLEEENGSRQCWSCNNPLPTGIGNSLRTWHVCGGTCGAASSSAHSVSGSSESATACTVITAGSDLCCCCESSSSSTSIVSSSSSSLSCEAGCTISESGICGAAASQAQPPQEHGWLYTFFARLLSFLIGTDAPSATPPATPACCCPSSSSAVSIRSSSLSIVSSAISSITSASSLSSLSISSADSSSSASVRSSSAFSVSSAVSSSSLGVSSSSLSVRSSSRSSSVSSSSSFVVSSASARSFSSIAVSSVSARSSSSMPVSSARSSSRSMSSATRASVSSKSASSKSSSPSSAASSAPITVTFDYCGDGIRQPQEPCDDGERNGQPGSNCTVTCQLVIASTSCGNGILNTGEECDQGPKNGRPGSTCTTRCQRSTGYCGDGIVQTALSEQCDLGKALNGQPDQDCDGQCHFVKLTTCGNGMPDPAFKQCDAGKLNSDFPGAPCRSNCMLPRCGDHILDPNEQCDDGNNLNNDGCSDVCMIEDRVAAAPLLPVAADVIASTPALAHVPSPARASTGPGLIIFLASGAAAGVGLMRRRRVK